MEIVLASFNANKAREIEKIISPVNVRALSEFGVTLDFDALETGGTYKENALIKLRAAAALVDGIVVAEDSGLEVEALGGRPGIHSARYGGAEIPDSERCQLLLKEMRDVPPEKRGARFVCVVAARMPDGAEHFFEGELKGFIHTSAEGSSGFGYDPVFFVPDRETTVALMTPDEKNKISHRSKAFKKLQDFLNKLV